VVSAVALVLLFGGQRVAPRFVWALFVLVLGLVASSVLDLATHGVEVVGRVPRGVHRALGR